MKICYTAIIGEYDILREPLIVDPDWVYVCFTTIRTLKSNIWNIIYLDSEHDTIKQARYIKIDPYFPYNYGLYLWVDGNIQIKTSLNDFIKPLLKYDLSLMSHPDRVNLFEEGHAVIRLKKDRADIINNQLMKYQSEGYDCNELAATGVILRRNTPNIKNHAYIWKNEILKHSHRDQMSFNYACWKTNIIPNYFQFDVIKDQNFIHHKHIRRIRI